MVDRLSREETEERLEDRERLLHWVMAVAGELSHEEFLRIGAPEVVWLRYREEVEEFRRRWELSDAGSPPSAPGPSVVARPASEAAPSGAGGFPPVGSRGLG